MKKFVAIGIVLLVLGAALFAGGFILSGGKISAMNISTGLFNINLGGDGGTYQQNEYVFDAKGVEALDIDTASDDVRLGFSDDGKVHVLCSESKNYKYTFKEGRTLKIKSGDQGFFLFNINLFGLSRRDDLTVLVPRDAVYDLNVSTASGNVRFSETMVFGDLSIDTASGDMSFGTFSAGSADVDTASGNVRLESANVAKRLSVGTTSGEVSVEDCKAGSLSVSTTSGDIEFGRAEVGSANFSTTSGEVDFGLLDSSGSVTVSTTSGDVDGTLAGSMSDYAITSDTTSGSNSLPSRTKGGEKKLNVDTTSGDIDIEFRGD